MFNVTHYKCVTLYLVSHHNTSQGSSSSPPSPSDAHRKLIVGVLADLVCVIYNMAKYERTKWLYRTSAAKAKMDHNEKHQHVMTMMIITVIEPHTHTYYTLTLFSAIVTL